MKKSTILLLAVVYILSFLVISLLGHSIRNYDPIVEPVSIELIDPDLKTDCSTVYNDDGTILYDYYFVYRNYENTNSLRLRAVVKPDNCTYPKVSFVKDETDTSFNIDTHDTKPETIEEGFAEITLNVDLDASNPILSATFFITSTNPGTKIKLSACVTFVSAALFM